MLATVMVTAYLIEKRQISAMSKSMRARYDLKSMVANEIGMVSKWELQSAKARERTRLTP